MSDKFARALCKFEYSSNEANLKKDKPYKIYSENDNFIWIITDGNKSTPHYLMDFTKAKSEYGRGSNLLLFYDYFYTTKEERKLKLQKINERKKGIL